MQHLFKKFENLKVLVIGDVMVDSYVWGKVSRISPEAPVPVVSVQRREKRLGGAANVALNVKALGAEPVLCSVVGHDDEGADILDLLARRNLSPEGILRSEGRITTVKHRILAGSQHMLRIDAETDRELDLQERNMLTDRVARLAAGADVIIFEDYDKGVLTPEVISAVIEKARQTGIPTVVDPKKRNFLSYSGCSLFKPNLKELKEGLKADFENFDIEEIKKAVEQLRALMPIERALITLSEHGIFISDFASSHHLPAHKREIADVSGAGDTVVSIAALCLAAGASLEEIAFLSNLGGGLVCEHLGVVPVDRQKLQEEALKLRG